MASATTLTISIFSNDIVIIHINLCVISSILGTNVLTLSDAILILQFFKLFSETLNEVFDKLLTCTAWAASEAVGTDWYEDLSGDC